MLANPMIKPKGNMAYCRWLLVAYLLLSLQPLQAQIDKGHAEQLQHLFSGIGASNTALSSTTDAIAPIEPMLRAATDCERLPYRTIDGSCNNISQEGRENWGAAGNQLFRQIPAVYGQPDPFNDLNGQHNPSPRTISNHICGFNPDKKSATELSSMVFTWGQFLDHDITLTPENPAENAPIPLPEEGDPMFGVPIAFHRSATHEGTGEDSPRQQTNLLSVYIDGSNVYGADEERAEWLRTFEHGKLKTSRGNMLPYNTLNGEIDGETDPNAPEMAIMNPHAPFFVAGDIRANEQPGLTALHTIFVREHNRICDQLLTQGFTDDEIIYQEARKRVSGIMQAITYNEFLPALGVKLRPYTGYKSDVNPAVSNVFATAAYRMGHTMVTNEMLMIDDACNDVEDGNLSLMLAFFNPAILQIYGIDPVLKGLTVQTQLEIDPSIIDNLRNFLFGPPGTGGAGLDLASLNIQRGRDHGLPPYVSIRQFFTNQNPITSFEEITSDIELREALREMYNDDVNNIDAWIGLLAEDHLNGSSVGLTLNAILKDQFERLRDGDFYFYQNDPTYSKKERAKIDRTSLSEIIQLNSNLSNISTDVFHAVPCIQMSTTNLDCAGSCEGTVEVSIKGGNPPFELFYKQLGEHWQELNPIQEELCPDTYLYQVLDINGNRVEHGRFTIDAPQALEVNVLEVISVSCESDFDGAFQVLAAGGVPPYQYKTAGSAYQTDGSFTNLAAGEYVITVRDAVACTYEMHVIVEKEQDCEVPCNCPEDYLPVCGENGLTYKNACEAICAGVDYGNGHCTCPFQNTYDECIASNERIEICPELCLNGKYKFTEINNLENGNVRLKNGCIKYKSHKDFVGDEHLEIRACDDEHCVDIWVNIKVGHCGDNLPPIAVDDHAISFNTSSIFIDVLKNDIDPEGGRITLESYGNPQHGYLGVSQNNFIYTPHVGFTGMDIVEYQICDEFRQCANAKLYIEVLEGFCPPIEEDACISAMDSYLFCPEFCHIEAPFTINRVSTNFACQLLYEEDDCILYQPLPYFDGPETIRIQACDLGNRCETISIEIMVSTNCNTGNEQSKTNNNIRISKGHLPTTLSLETYPNPTQDKLQVSIPSPAPQAVQARLTDISGQVLVQAEWDLQAGENRQSVDMRDWATGIYLLTIVTEEGDVLIQKVVKD